MRTRSHRIRVMTTKNNFLRTVNYTMKIFKITAISLLVSVLLIFFGCDTVRESSVSGGVLTGNGESAESVVEVSQETREDYISRINKYYTKYFVQKLDDNMLKYFSIIYSNAENFQADVDFGTEIQSKDLDIMMYLLNYDCPELIHTAGEYIPKYVDEEHTRVSGVKLVFIMNREQRDSAQKKLDVFMEDLIKKIGSKADLEREKYVYDYLFNNTVYDDKDTYSGSIYGTIINHKARCEGLCKSFMWCMRNLGNKCLCVSGTPKWENDSEFSSHSWNIVQIKNKFYHLDITIDNMNTDEPGKNPPTYGFFNVSDKEALESRSIDDVYVNLGIPECNDESINYHKMNGLYVNKTDDIKTPFTNILLKNFKNGILDNLSVKFESSENYDELAEKIDDIISDFLRSNTETNYHYKIYYNDLTRTIILHAAPSESSGSSESSDLSDV